MCVGERFAFICLDSIPDISQRLSLIEILEDNNKEIIELSFEQMENFAGNMLVVKNKKDELVLVLSKTAKDSLDKEQLEKISKHYPKIVVYLPNVTNCSNNRRCRDLPIFSKHSTNNSSLMARL